MFKDSLRELLRVDHPYGLARSTVVRLQKRERHRSEVVKFFGRDLLICDAPSFLSAHKEIFVRGIFRFTTTKAAPRIIDGGANIGLATLYLKKALPGADIIAVEADPDIADVLDHNIRVYGLSGVRVVRGALWDSAGPIRFAPDRADGGSVAGTGDVTVQGVLLSDLIGSRAVDFLKLDVEGAETRVLEEAADHLKWVERLFVEYHSYHELGQSLHVVLRILGDAGFRYYLENANPYRFRPLLQGEIPPRLDLQVNIFAWREAVGLGGRGS